MTDNNASETNMIFRKSHHVDAYEEILRAVEYCFNNPRAVAKQQALAMQIDFPVAPPPLSFTPANLDIVIPISAGFVPGVGNRMAHNKVMFSDLISAGLAPMPWSIESTSFVELYMEVGQDRRKMNSKARHPIDFFRGPSVIGFPPLMSDLIKYEDPYYTASTKGLKFGQTASQTYRVIKNTSVGLTFDAVIDELARQFGTSDRTAVRDTLRDLALFGIVHRLENPDRPRDSLDPLYCLATKS